MGGEDLAKVSIGGVSSVERCCWKPWLAGLNISGCCIFLPYPRDDGGAASLMMTSLGKSVYKQAGVVSKSQLREAEHSQISRGE